MAGDTRGKRILVVEDAADERSYLATLLEDNGYVVVVAKDGEEALEAVRLEKPDLVTLDISMPRKSGLRFYREVKGDPTLASVPVVVITGVTGHGQDSDALKRFLGSRTGLPPPAGFIAKPVDKQEVLDTVSELLD